MVHKDDIYMQTYLPFYSASYTQKYLLKAYQKQNLSDAAQYSFSNCYPFISYVENGLLYLKQASMTPDQIKPLLLYYGLTHLLKACVLIFDPNYPETTAVLAHGVSTRKKKKQQYEFLMDEVKIQRNGLFTHLTSKMFHMKPAEEKHSMITLLKEIPEISTLFTRMKGQTSHLTVSFQEGAFHIGQEVLDHYHMTLERFLQHAEGKWQLPIDYERVAGEDKLLKIGLRESFTNERRTRLPFRYDCRSDMYTLSLQKDETCQQLPDLLVMYLLLYNLSMIARYEIDWWTELFKEMGHHDLPFIKGLMEVAEFKIPLLIRDWMKDKEGDFY